jgi:thiol-disulfide isomerase/thioredoxin
MIDPSWGFFQDTKRYDEILAEYASKIKRNPNSSYYMNRLALTPNFYKNKKDIANLYYLFSKEMQDSYFGKIVYNNFSTFSISNVALKNCETGIEEGIVADFDKYTLLIFSASWCGPCHKKIPLLKDIYNKMGDNLNMVYITTDEEKYLPQWKKLMSKEKIPWRSLSFNQALKEAWNIKAIPDYILIDTHWNARKINLNEQEDLDNLYSIISSK